MREINVPVRYQTRRIVPLVKDRAIFLLVLSFLVGGFILSGFEVKAQDSRLPRSGSTGTRRVHSTGFPGDDQERTRPPKPTKQRDDLHFPPGFLQLSKPSEQPVASDTPQAEKREPSSTPATAATDKNDVTGPTLSRDDSEPNIEPLRARDDTALLGIVVSAALLGIFVFADYRYRCWLQSALLENNRLLAPDAVPSDFDEVFLAAGTQPLWLAGAASGNYPLFDSLADYDPSAGFTAPEGTIASPVSSLVNNAGMLADGFFASSAEPEA